MEKHEHPYGYGADAPPGRRRPAAACPWAGMRPVRAWAGTRLVRAGVFTVAGTGLAVVGHHVASGEPLSWGGLLGAALAVFALALPWAGLRRSLPGVLAATFAAQLVAHEILAAAARTAAATGEASGPARASAAAGFPLPARASEAAGHLAGMRHGLGHPAAAASGHGLSVGDGTMLLAHVLAAVAVAVLLYATDARLSALPALPALRALPVVLGRLAGAVRAALARCLPRGRCRKVPSRAGRRRSPAPFDTAPGTPADALLAHVLVRRGPPGPLVCATTAQ
ncbi:hypothetical protein AB0P17_23830 [Streptomyces sp. NPDC088124]|uniref:hypothetical protein n=1 Tax=Streptomyces sp. NPDC088124 TaxID=3154654 RepID=UPI00341FBE8C